MTTPGRRLDLATLVLKPGRHPEAAWEFCLFEAVAYLAGEPWSVAPDGTCPVLRGFLGLLNDLLPDDATRTRLLVPLIPRLVDSRTGSATTRRRACRLADFAVREVAPIALDAAGWRGEAGALRRLPPVHDAPTARSAAVGARQAAAAAYAAAHAVDAAAVTMAAYTSTADAADAADAAARLDDGPDEAAAEAALSDAAGWSAYAVAAAATVASEPGTALYQRAVAVAAELLP